MRTNEYTVRLVDMPPSVRGMLVMDVEGWPNIYINARLSKSAQQAAFLHELKDLENGDVDNNKPIGDIERW